MPSVQTEIRQSKPFRSRAQEATIALLRTASIVQRALAREIEPWGISLAQYNALRIVRGAGRDGIPTLGIRDRMVEEGTPITRLVDKLEAAGYLIRRRSSPDRRQVRCYITDRGRRLLDATDPIVNAADEAVVSVLGPSDLTRLLEMLERVRGANAGRATPRSRAGGADAPPPAPPARRARR
jgi:DNA-binding MarR family transcriptional regulator